MEAASHVVHRECRAAPLSPELSEQQNFRGLFNLGGLIIVRLVFFSTYPVRSARRNALCVTVVNRILSSSNNVGVMAQFVTNFRLIVENLLKYGLLIKFDGALWTSWRAWPCCSTLLGTHAIRVSSEVIRLSYLPCLRTYAAMCEGSYERVHHDQLLLGAVYGR
jgi:hypothetical protein